MDALPLGLEPALRRRAERAGAWLWEQRDAGRTVTVVHHLDADGVSAAGIAAACLERANIPFLLQCVKSLDAAHVALVQGLGPEALWFCDLGSAAYMHFPGVPRLVCDHHQLVRDGGEEGFAHLNPLLDGIDGGTVSGSGLAYLAAAALDAGNRDLLPMALVGAAGDLQDRRGGFNGANAALLADGLRHGLVEERQDLAWFGTETRTLRRLLALAPPPGVPGATGNQRSAESFLLGCGVPLDDGGRERRWADLSEAERVRVRSGLAHRLADCGLAAEVPALWRPVVTVPREAPGSPVRELQEFATLLNSTARHGRPEVGIAIARGDRGTRYREALELLGDHRRHLMAALGEVSRRPVAELRAVQWVHLQDSVLDTIVGTVAGMALGGLGLRRDLALVAFAYTPDGRVKVSTRSPYELQSRGIDLATAVRGAAALVDGQGGGHPGAAGATIPKGSEEAFLRALDDAVAGQLHVGAAPALPVPAVPAGPPA